jgi:peroxiredoxin
MRTSITHMRPTLTRLVATLSVAVALIFAPMARADALTDALRSGGMSPLQPNPAPSVELATIQGAEHGLSDHAGRWVLLTFFATWCGPCKKELPSLSALHAKTSPQGFDVMAVSIDRTAAPLKGYLKKLNPSFPVVHDGKGQAARAYQASSVPVSFLIDTEGRLVAMARGARDWTRAEGMVQALLSLQAPDPSAEPTWSTAPVELAPNITPPSAQARLVKPLLAVGEEAQLEVAVDWAGGLQDYLPQPPALTTPDGLELTSTSARSASDEGRTTITYTLTLATSAPGEFPLDPVEVRYLPHGSTETLATQIEGPMLVVATPDRTLPAGLAAGGLLALAFAGGGLVVARRRRAPVPIDRAAQHLAALRARFAGAREARIAGDNQRFVVEIAALLHDLGDSSDALRAQAESARYGGTAPDRGVLDALERRAARALKRASGPTQAVDPAEHLHRDDR